MVDGGYGKDVGRVWEWRREGVRRFHGGFREGVGKLQAGFREG